MTYVRTISGVEYDSNNNGVDASTSVLMNIPYDHHEVHSGSMFYVLYSVASLGAMTTPDDMITLNWKTPDTTEWGHFQFFATATAGGRIRLIEAPTGGAASATGTFTILNKNRNSVHTSTFTDTEGSPTANQVSYDATLATGGTTLWDQYLEGPTTGLGVTARVSSSRDEIMLKQNTQYQLSLYGTATNGATLYMVWYEHTDKN